GIVPVVGQNQMVACRYAKSDQSKSNGTSRGLGTTGFGLPPAIGAGHGAPHREVIAIIGDGGLHMIIQESGTILQFGAKVKIMILNNSFLCMVRQWQQLLHEKPYSFVNITSPEFVALAKSYYIEAQKVSERAGLLSALETMLNHDGS